MSLILSIFGMILTIFCVVGVHEFGHFIVARLVGVKVLRFSIGFGKALYRWHGKTGTEYVLAAIPLGGYIKMLDEAEGKVSKHELAFAYNRQPFYKKFAIVAAGPFFNFIFSFLIYWVIFMVGFTTIIPMIGKVMPNSIAAIAGLQPQQEIIQINTQPTSNWMKIVMRLLSHTGDKDSLIVTTKNIDTQIISNNTLDLTQWKMNDLKPDPLESLGIIPFEPEVPAIIGHIEKTSEKNSFIIGDQIIAINNILIKDWYDVTKIINEHPNAELIFKIKRKNLTKTETINLTVHTGSERDLTFRQYGYIGIGPLFVFPEKLLRHNQYGPLAALSHAWQDTKDFTYLNILVVKKLLSGKMSLASLGGPISIFQSAGAALNHGLIPFVSFLAFLSIAIGFINILPIPGLDGGHVLFQVIELIRRRPLSLPAQSLFYRIGLILLLLLITQAVVNDVLRL